MPLNAPQSKSAQSLPSADLDASTLGAREKGKGKAIEPEGVNQVRHRYGHRKENFILNVQKTKVFSGPMSPWQDPQLRPYTLIPPPEGHSPRNIEMPVSAASAATDASAHPCNVENRYIITCLSPRLSWRLPR